MSKQDSVAPVRRSFLTSMNAGMAALEFVDNMQPGIALIRIGREEESQRVVVGSAAGGPGCQ